MLYSNPMLLKPPLPTSEARGLNRPEITVYYDIKTCSQDEVRIYKQTFFILALFRQKAKTDPYNAMQYDVIYPDTIRAY
jgi:hypothetical protein